MTFYTHAEMTMAYKQQERQNFRTVRITKQAYDYVCEQGFTGQTFDETLRAILGLDPAIKIRKTQKSSSRAGNTLFSEKEISVKT